DFVKVLDFGLVRLSPNRGAADLKLTADGSAGGTPAYMAPEIALGADQYDHRVDIYSIGCVAYWMLTGHMVFEGTSAMKGMLDHAGTVPARPSTRTELPIPGDVEQIVMACLEKDPARRPQNARALGERLAACAAANDWTWQRAERWWQMHLPQRAPDRSVA